MQTFKNWAQINALQNFVLKFFVTFANEPDELTRIERGWPELFSQQPDWLCVSANVLELASQGLGGGDEGEWNAMNSWLDAVRDVNIPIAFSWDDQANIPPDLVEILNRRDDLQSEEHARNWCGEKLSWQNKEYVIVEVHPLTLVESRYIFFDRPYQDVSPDSA